MGKNLIQQRRGRGSKRYRAHSFHWKGASRHKQLNNKKMSGKIIDLIKCPGHSAPLAKIQYVDGEQSLSVAPEGVKIGDLITMGGEDFKEINGNTYALNLIPEGTLIFNIEKQPGDGGKFVRSSGVFAKVVAKSEKFVSVKLPSKKVRKFIPSCRASIGVVAGGGRKEKPFLKAGKRYHLLKIKNKKHPNVSGTSKNALDHPFGGTHSSHKGRPTIAPRDAPAGRKVGKIRPKRTGYRKG